jgi:hypothetical protein
MQTLEARPEDDLDAQLEAMLMKRVSTDLSYYYRIRANSKCRPKRESSGGSRRRRRRRRSE